MSTSSALMMLDGGATPAVETKTKAPAPGKEETIDETNERDEAQASAEFGSVFQTMLGLLGEDPAGQERHLFWEMGQVGLPDTQAKTGSKSGQKAKVSATGLLGVNKKAAVPFSPVHVQPAERGVKEKTVVSPSDIAHRNGVDQKILMQHQLGAAVQDKTAAHKLNSMHPTTGVSPAQLTKTAAPESADAMIKLNLETGALKKMGLAPVDRKVKGGGSEGKIKIEAAAAVEKGQRVEILDAAPKKEAAKAEIKTVSEAGGKTAAAPQATAQKNGDPHQAVRHFNKPAMEVQRDAAQPVNQQAPSSESVKMMIEDAPLKSPSLTAMPSVEATISKIEQAPVVLRDAVVEQIRPALTKMVRQGDSKITLSLKPETLGAVQIEVESSKGVVEVRFMVETTEVKNLMDGSLADLKSALNREGIEPGSFQVDLHQESASKQGEGSGSNRQGGRGQTAGYPGGAEEDEAGSQKKQTRSFGYNSMELEA